MKKIFLLLFLLPLFAFAQEQLPYRSPDGNQKVDSALSVRILKIPANQTYKNTGATDAPGQYFQLVKQTHSLKTSNGSAGIYVWIDSATLFSAAHAWGALQSFGTNISIGGVTATGATGSGNAVFSANSTLTGLTNLSQISTANNIVGGAGGSSNLAFGTLGTSNFVSYASNVGAASSSSLYVFGTAASVQFRNILGGSNSSVVLTAGNSYANTIVAASAISLPGSGTTPMISQFVIKDFGTITNSSSIPVTEKNLIYIEAPVAVPNSSATLLYSVRLGGALKVDAPIVIKGYTVSTLPTGVVGATAYVTDALTPAFGVTLVGGGAVVTKAFYNGTNWIAE